MAHRRVLILTYHFPPSAAVGGMRLLSFCRYLPKFGWGVDVVAPPGLPWEPVDPALREQVPRETIVHSVPFTGGIYSEIARRIAVFESWLPKAWMASRRAIRQRRPDVLLTSSPPHHIHALGLNLKRRYHIPWVADFRDPWLWTANLHDPFMSRPLNGTWKDHCRRAMERAVIRGSDTIIANAPQSFAALTEAYPADTPRMEMITNGFDPEPFAGLAGPDSADPLIHLLYSGQLYMGRDPRPFLDALRTVLAARPRDARLIHTTFVGALGFDPLDYDLHAEILNRGLSNMVEVQERISYVDSLAAMAQSSILLLIDTPGRRIGVAAKLYEYIGAGRPVLALVEPDSDAAWVLRQTGIPYRIAAPTDPEAIRRALVELLEIVETGSAATAPVPGRLLFTRESLAQRLASVLDRCVEADGTAAMSQHGAPSPATEPTRADHGDYPDSHLNTSIS